MYYTYYTEDCSRENKEIRPPTQPKFQACPDGIATYLRIRTKEELADDQVHGGYKPLTTTQQSGKKIHVHEVVLNLFKMQELNRRLGFDWSITQRWDTIKVTST